MGCQMEMVAKERIRRKGKGLKGNKEIVEMLFQHKKIDINHQDNLGFTALAWASQEGHKEIVEMLLKDERIEINQQDEDGDIALMFASKKSQKEIAEMLIIK